VVSALWTYGSTTAVLSRKQRDVAAVIHIGVAVVVKLKSRRTSLRHDVGYTRPAASHSHAMQICET
jgi:hypothetical protein